MSEKCDRCGEVGEDRRTLSMECFYAMEELAIPFKPQVLLQFKDVSDLEPGPTAPVNIPVKGHKPIVLSGGSVVCKGELFPRSQYTLRVCKDCRASWMEAIERWFKNVDKPQKTGTGVFIRKNGATIELTPEEVEQFKKDRGFKPDRVGFDGISFDAIDVILANAKASIKSANELMADVKKDRKKKK